MVDVDKLNEEIEKFGMVVEKMDDLPKIYEDVKIQLDICREASNELKMTREDLDKFISATGLTLSQQHKESIEKLSTIERNFELKLDKAEVSLRDRISLSESNTTLALNDLKRAMETTAVELKQAIDTATTDINKRLDTEAAENKKRFIIITACVVVSIIIGVVRFIV